MNVTRRILCQGGYLTSQLIPGSQLKLNLRHLSYLQHRLQVQVDFNFNLEKNAVKKLNYSTAPAGSQIVTESEEKIVRSAATGGEEKIYPPKLVKIVDEISRLSLLEVADLNQLLKKTLNIPDAPSMPMGFSFSAGGAGKSEEEDAAPVAVQTSFTLKLIKFEEGKKVPLIKEVKNLIEGMNLVQAKKFVESSPTVFKADISKDEAEKLKTALEAVGATCEIS